MDVCLSQPRHFHQRYPLCTTQAFPLVMGECKGSGGGAPPWEAGHGCSPGLLTSRLSVIMTPSGGEEDCPSTLGRAPIPVAGAAWPTFAPPLQLSPLPWMFGAVSHRGWDRHPLSGPRGGQTGRHGDELRIFWGLPRVSREHAYTAGRRALSGPGPLALLGPVPPISLDSLSPEAPSPPHFLSSETPGVGSTFS